MPINDREFFDFINQSSPPHVERVEITDTQRNAIDNIASILALYYLRLMHFGMSEFAAAMLTEAYYKQMIERVTGGK